MTTETEVQPLDHAARLAEIFADFEFHGAPGATTAKTYLFKLAGEGGGQFLLTLSSEGANWQSDYEGDADVCISLTTDDLIAIADGEIDGRFAVASERIEIEGDMEAGAQMIDLMDAESAAE